MSNKLELKDIACYLPYGLKCASNSSCVSTVIGLTKGTANDIVRIKPNDGRDYPVPVGSIKPILRPMSDLINPLPDGTIPIVEIARILSDTIHVERIEGACKNLNYFRCMFDDGFEELIINEKCEGWYRSYFDKNSPGTGRNTINQFKVLDYLHAHHFDINNLIGRGLAIDINTVKM